MALTKKITMFSIILAATTVFAQTKISFSGSDTLGGVMTDAIIAAGLNQKIVYSGGGSGVGEKALINGEIAIAAMSREFKPEALELAKSKGIFPVSHVIALDGIGVFVHSTNSLAALDLPLLSKVFTCELTSWNQIPGSGKNGPIAAYRRNDQSGTTDTFKQLVGIKNFGTCVSIVNETADIADITSQDPNAIGYAGLSAMTEKNKAVAISAKSGQQPVLPLTLAIRNGTYPLSRKLFVYESTGAKTVTGAEEELLGYLLDRSFLDPIVQDHDFITID